MPWLCKQWSCETCAELLRRKVIATAAYGAPTTLMTLTCNPRRFLNPDQAANAMQDQFEDMIKRLRERYAPQELEYLKVWERTQAGWPHLHVLLRAPFIPQRWIADWWERHTGARIVDIRQVKNPTHAARYIAKYIGKNIARFGNQNRWSKSHGWKRPYAGTQDDPATRTKDPALLIEVHPSRAPWYLRSWGLHPQPTNYGWTCPIQQDRAPPIDRLFRFRKLRNPEGVITDAPAAD